MNTTTIEHHDIVEGTVPLRLGLQIPTKALIEWVNQAYETEAIFYWVQDAKDGKRAPLEIIGFKHDYCYQFSVQSLEGSWHQIDVAIILKGIEAIASGKVKVYAPIKDYVLRGALEACSEGAGSFDNETLDVVIQAGLFGELIYG